jgi:acetyl esterase/lipase
MLGKTPDALNTLYRQWMAEIQGNPTLTIDGIRDLFEHWGDVTAEPGNTDYLTEEVNGLKALWVVPKGCVQGKVLLCAHGGGYILGSIYSHRKLFGHFAARVGCRALIVDYRRAPEYPHPVPVNDMTDAYRWLLASGAVSGPGDVAFLGDSAGGALSITTMLLARERGLPMPAAAVALAPYLDMEALGESYGSNAAFDRLGNREGNLRFISVFLGPQGNPRDPLANPLFADLTGLPPIYLQVGGHDVLADDSVRFHARAMAAGIHTTLDIAPEMPHVFQFLAGNVLQADEAIARAAAWAKPYLGLA